MGNKVAYKKSKSAVLQRFWKILFEKQIRVLLKNIWRHSVAESRHHVHLVPPGISELLLRKSYLHVWRYDVILLANHHERVWVN